MNSEGKRFGVLLQFPSKAVIELSSRLRQLRTGIAETIDGILKEIRAVHADEKAADGIPDCCPHCGTSTVVEYGMSGQTWGCGTSLSYREEERDEWKF